MYRYVLKYRVCGGEMHELKFMTQTGCYLFIKMLLDDKQVSFIQVKEIDSMCGSGDSDAAI